jgi:hypothetical protein
LTHVDEFWLVCAFPGDDELEIVHSGTKEECEAELDYIIEEESDGSFEFFIVAVVKSVSFLPTGE